MTTLISLKSQVRGDFRIKAPGVLALQMDLIKIRGIINLWMEFHLKIQTLTANSPVISHKTKVTTKTYQLLWNQIKSRNSLKNKAS